MIVAALSVVLVWLEAISLSLVESPSNCTFSATFALFRVVSHTHTERSRICSSSLAPLQFNSAGADGGQGASVSWLSNKRTAERRRNDATRRPASEDQRISRVAPRIFARARSPALRLPGAGDSTPGECGEGPTRAHNQQTPSTSPTPPENFEMSHRKNGTAEIARKLDKRIFLYFAMVVYTTRWRYGESLKEV